MSSFAGLNTALSGLMAQRRAVEVTGQNVANSATPGYVRQRVELSPLGGAALPSVHARPQVVGQGVEVTGVQRLSDAFLDARARTEGGRLAGFTEDAEALGRIEQLLAEPGDTGLSAQLSQFWSSWSTVANNPDSLAARGELLQRAETLVQTLSDSGSALVSQWDAGREQLSALAAQVTVDAAAVADLNAAIKSATVSGAPANELLDRRDVLVNRITEQTGATVRPGQYGTVDVLVGGVELVTGDVARSLDVTGSATLAGTATNPVGLTISGVAATPAAGRTSAVLTTLNTRLPGTVARFDAVAASLAGDVNAVHTSGQGLATGSPPVTATGMDFFSGSTAATLAVAITDPRDVAAAPAGGGAFSGGNADRMASIAGRTDGPDATWRTVVVDLGVAAQGATRRAGIQDVVSRQASAAREAVSGVSIDEEMTQLVAYQRAYEGAARMISAVDQMLDTLINRTGLVGR